MIRDILLAGNDEPPGFPMEQMWMCREVMDHSTQFPVRLHRRHYSEGSGEREEMIWIRQMMAEGCEVCGSQVEHEEMQREAYDLLDLIHGLEMVRRVWHLNLSGREV